MHRIRSVGLTLPFVVLMLGADSAPITALKEKGLIKSGVTFVVEAEKPVFAKVKELRTAFADYTALAEHQEQAEQFATNLTQLEERRVDLEKSLTDLNQQINEQGYQQGGNSPQQGPNRAMVQQLIAQRNMIKATLVEVTTQQKYLKSQAPTDNKPPVEETKKSAEACKAIMAELRPMVAAVIKQYAELGADSSVKASINELEKATNVDFKLGPSDAFKVAAKALDQAESRLLGKKTVSVTKKKVRSRK